MKIIIAILIFILGFGSGLYFGFKKVPEEFLYWNSQFKASLLAFELEALNEGKDIKETKEIYLNGELANYGHFLDSHYAWVFPYLTGLEFDPKYITHAVEYRLANPYTDPDLSVPGSWNSSTDINTPFVQEVIEGQKENRALIEKVTKLYGAK